MVGRRCQSLFSNAEPLLSLRLALAASPHAARELQLVRHVVAYDHGDAPSAYGARRDDDISFAVPTLPRSTLHPVAARLPPSPRIRSIRRRLDAYYGTALPLVLQATRGVSEVTARRRGVQSGVGTV